MVSTNTQGQLLQQSLSIIRRRSKEEDMSEGGFLNHGVFSLEALDGMPYYGVSILEPVNRRSIRSTPHQEVAA
jgi:hypothetical protein